MNSNVTITGSLGFNQVFCTQNSLSGSGSLPPGATPNLFYIPSDSFDAGGAFVNGAVVSHVFGGATAKGGRQAFASFLALTMPTNSGNINRNYVAGQFTGYALSGDGGTSAAPKGAIFGSSSWGDLQSGAVNFLNVCASELNVSARVGSSVRHKSILQLVEHNLDAVSGVGADAALVISGQPGAIGLNHGIDFSDMAGANPVKASGTLIGMSQPNSVSMQAANGIDFTNWVFSSASIRMPGFVVDPTGHVTASGLNLQLAGASNATGGAASVLPAQPSAYITIQINGSNFKIPVYNP